LPVSCVVFCFWLSCIPICETNIAMTSSFKMLRHQSQLHLQFCHVEEEWEPTEDKNDEENQRKKWM
jgi:hypothetical protein